MKKRNPYVNLNEAQQAVEDALKEAVSAAEKPHLERRAALQARVEGYAQEEISLKLERKALCEAMRTEDCDFDRIPEIDNRLVALTTLQKDIQDVKVWIAQALQNLKNAKDGFYKRVRDISLQVNNTDRKLNGPMTRSDRDSNEQHRRNLVQQAADTFITDREALKLYRLDTKAVITAYDEWLSVLQPTDVPKEAA